MERFRVHKKGETYSIIPTAEFLKEVYNDAELPFDTTWQIYKLYNFPPQDFFTYIIVKFGASVFLKKTFPYATFYFNDRASAIQFKVELEERFFMNGKNRE